MRSRHESRLVEVDSGRQRDFESKLAELMQQLRHDHEYQLQDYKDEMHRTFSSRVHSSALFLLLFKLNWQHRCK